MPAELDRLIPNIHLLGIQGSGKGTQSSLLVQALNLTYLPSGNLFRERAAVDDTLGRQIKEKLALGRLLGEDILFDTVKDFLDTHTIPRGLLCDGVTRTLDQYRVLESLWLEHNLSTPFIICLDLSDEDALERIEKREQRDKQDPALQTYHQIYSGKLLRRTDDNPNAIATRLALYHEMTEPLIAAATEAGQCVHVPANRDVDTIHREIVAIATRRFPELL